MVAKVMADRTGVDPAPGAADDGGSPDLERDVAAFAAWFEGLPPSLQRWFDREAESGQKAYGQA